MDCIEISDTSGTDDSFEQQEQGEVIQSFDTRYNIPVLTMATTTLENGSKEDLTPMEVEKTTEAKQTVEKEMPQLIPFHQIKKEPGTEEIVKTTPEKNNYKSMDFDIPAEDRLIIDEVASKAMLKFAEEVKKENGTALQFDQASETLGTVNSSVTLSDGTLLDSADSQYIVQKTCTKTICKYCAYQFTSPSEIQYHIQMHKKGKAPHACSQCGKEYRTPSKLQRHVRVHSGERPYGCDVCGKRFTRSDHVKQHMKTHQPQKQMNICRLCDMKFIRPQNLHQHLQQAHDIEPTFKCHRCGEVFETLENLNSHMQSHDPYHQEMVNGMRKMKQEIPVDGIAKFNLGPQKYENHNSNLSLSSHADCYETLSKEDTNDSIEGVPQISYKLITEHMIESFNKKEEESKLNAEELENMKKTETVASQDGMSMFIVPSDMGDPASPASSNENDESTESIIDIDSEAKHDNDNNFVNPNKVEVRLGEEKAITDTLDAENEKKENIKDSEDLNSSKDLKVGQDSKQDTQAAANTQNQNHVPILPKVKEGLIACNPHAPMVSLIKSSPKISQLLREKVTARYTPYSRPVDIQPAPQPLLSKNNILYTDSHGKANFMIIKPIQGMSVASSLTTNTSKLEQKPVTPPAVSMATPVAVATPSTHSTPSVTPPPKTTQPPVGKKMLRCEHCCIWFDDIAMSSLHHTLHLADEADPFTCPKCLKKLGNRLEFMAHLIYHLQPNMDI